MKNLLTLILAFTCLNAHAENSSAREQLLRLEEQRLQLEKERLMLEEEKERLRLEEENERQRSDEGAAADAAASRAKEEERARAEEARRRDEERRRAEIRRQDDARRIEETRRQEAIRRQQLRRQPPSRKVIPIDAPTRLTRPAPTQPPVRSAPADTGTPAAGGGDGPVNLDDLDSDAPAATQTKGKTKKSRGGPHHSSGSAPIFKILFDTILHHRPGISPLTFDNYHTLMLVDFLPTPDMRFSFELKPQTRYYEFEYEINKQLSFRVGKIAVPFDDMNPHNLYGGFMNTSLIRPTGAPAFLPDIWADLGVGLRYRWNNRDFDVVTDFTITNGFKSGGTDPTGTVGSVYPNYGSTDNIDNNDDKALGVRSHLWWRNTIGAGISAYTCRYTANSEPAKRLLMLGLDAQLRLPSKFQAKIGYAYMKTELAPPSVEDSFLRGGVYVDLEQKFGRFFVGARGGLMNTDNRVEDQGDMQIVGGRFGYMTDIWQIALQVHQDIKKIDAKTNYNYKGLRFVIML